MTSFMIFSLTHIYSSRENGCNIFPNIDTVDTIRIEAWNPDFDCSALYQQWPRRFANVICNGTNPVNTTAKSNMPSTPAQTSQAPQTNPEWMIILIAVLITLLALGLVSGACWLCWRVRSRRRRETQRASENMTDLALQTPIGSPNEEGAQLDSTEVQEAGSEEKPSELQSPLIKSPVVEESALSRSLSVQSLGRHVELE